MSASPRRLWYTVDGDIVEDGDPTARFLCVGEGCEIPDGLTIPDAPKGTKKAEAGKVPEYPTPKKKGDPVAS
jgi:hypothetical protein